MKQQLYTKLFLISQILLSFISCSSNDVSQSIILTKKNGQTIIITAPREVAHFEEYLNKLQQDTVSQKSKLPEKILNSVNEVLSLKLKDKTLTFRNEGIYLESNNQLKKVSCSSGLLYFIYCLNSVSEMNKELFRNGIALEFDSFELINTFSHKNTVIKSEETVSALQKALIEGSKDYQGHLSYINFSHFAILRRYEIVFFNNSRYAGEIEFDADSNSYFKFKYSNEQKLYEDQTLTFTDKKNYIRKVLNPLLKDLEKNTKN